MIKHYVSITGDLIAYEEDVLKDRVEFARKIKQELEAGKLTSKEATTLLNDFGKNHPLWR